ncbi:hypothetical protein [Paenisporosarcina indica]|uniref:hypothetical protein n=1 Tax=Paenisporosarcina indica TaxID=650093 RepID=UPI000A0570DE|nr:hypothetical protein [Paenisporosarcina indica]
MKKTALFMVFGLFLGLAGCGNQVQDDLLNYINNDMSSIIDLETKAISEYESVTGSNYTNDEDMYLHLIEVVLPAYQILIEEAEAIDPDTPEVIQVHELYLEATNTQYNAIIKVLAALEAQDYDLISDANHMLSEGRSEMRNFIKSVQQLAEENNVEITED